LGLQEEGTTFRHITDERDKLDFIQDVGYDFLENKLYFQKEQKEQKEPTRFELDNPFYIRKIHDFILNIWKEVQESYVNFLCETEGLIERMQKGIYEYLMRFFPYAWDNYYDVGPWTVTTFFKLTKSDKIECREQILINMNELLYRLYFPKEEMSKDLIKNIVLQLSILQKIFHNIPLVPTIIIKDREGEGAQMIEEVGLQGGGSAQGGGNVAGGYGGRRERKKRFKIQFQQMNAPETDISSFGNHKVIRDLLQQNRLGGITEQVLQRQLQRNIHVENNENFVQLFLALLREFDTCPDVNNQFEILERLRKIKDIYKRIIGERNVHRRQNKYTQFLAFIEPWVDQRIDFREQFLFCYFSLFFKIIQVEIHDEERMILLRMKKQQISRLWKCFLYRQLKSGKERLDISALFLKNIFRAFHDANIVEREKLEHLDYKDKGLLVHRLGELLEFFIQHQMELFPRNLQRQNIGCVGGGVGGGVGSEGNLQEGGGQQQRRKVKKVRLTEQQLDTLFEIYTKVPGWGKYTNFFKELSHTLSSPSQGPQEKSESDVLRLLYIFIFTKYVENYTFYDALVISDFAEHFIKHIFPPNLQCQQSQINV
jgi:hypothetical protein